VHPDLGCDDADGAGNDDSKSLNRQANLVAAFLHHRKIWLSLDHDRRGKRTERRGPVAPSARLRRRLDTELFFNTIGTRLERDLEARKLVREFF